MYSSAEVTFLSSFPEDTYMNISVKDINWLVTNYLRQLKVPETIIETVKTGHQDSFIDALSVLTMNRKSEGESTDDIDNWSEPSIRCLHIIREAKERLFKDIAHESQKQL